MSALRDDVKGRIDAIEKSYEYLLAYAAQGLPSDVGSKSGGQLREYLSKAVSAIDGLADALTGLAQEEAFEPAGQWSDVLDVIARDASDTLAAVRLVSAQASVSSQLVDNLNANIHLRALLTDLFLVDELIGT
ncbi:MAG: hypothetical protein ACKVG4_05230 [Longimicrobiales bacterium]